MKAATKSKPKTKTPGSDLLPSLGKFVCRWIERNLVHGEGDYLGELFKLEGWQRDFIYRLYEYDPVTYKRIVRRALMLLPKGCGKTELIAAICLAELAGPVIPHPDGPKMRQAPNIPVAAASLAQANRLFGAARIMATEGALSPYVDAYDLKIMLKARLGQIVRVAAESGTNDGGLPTCFGADEIHEWEGRTARVHLVIGNSLAKRDQGLELNISTPDDARPDSLLGKMVAHGDKVLSGEIVDPTFLYVRYSASMEWDLNDPVQLRKAIEECTPASWQDIERIAARYEIDKVPEHEFRRYNLAQFVRRAEQWLPTGAWAKCEKERQLEPGDEIALGFDGSYNNDSTGLVATRLSDFHSWVVGAWERPEGVDDWKVPREEVKAKVKEAFETYNVSQMYCDPPGWHHEVDEWADAYGDEVVLEFSTNSRQRMSAACSRFYSAVINEAMTHDGDPRLARHLANAVIKETPDGAYITKDGRNSPRKIDLAIAAVLSLAAASQRVEETVTPNIW